MSRMLAAKASLCTRVDALGEECSFEMGAEHKVKLEARLRLLEEGNIRKLSGTAKAKATFEKFHAKSEILEYPVAADSTIKTEKKPLIEVIGETESPVKRKHSESVEEASTSEVSKKKKKKKIKQEPEEMQEVKEEVKEETFTEELTEETEVSEKKKKKKKKKEKEEPQVEEEVKEEPEAEEAMEETERKKKKKKKKVKEEPTEEDN